MWLRKSWTKFFLFMLFISFVIYLTVWLAFGNM